MLMMVGVIVIMVVGVVMIMVVGVVIMAMMIVGGYGVGDEVKESVSQEPPRGEAEEDFQEGGVVLGILQGDAEQDEEWRSTDEGRGGEGVRPQLPGALEGSRKLEDEVPGR